MKKIKSIKWSVELSYRDTFVFVSITDAAAFIATAAHNAEDPEGVTSFRLVPYIEYEEEVEPIYCETDSLKEADKIKMKQLLNEKYGRVCADVLDKIRAEIEQMNNIDYVEPVTVDEVLKIIDKYKGGDKDV